jgi:hypothetical protein
VQWWTRLLAFSAVCAIAHAAGPVEFGMAEYDAAVAARHLKYKPKIIAELNLEPPETFRIEPYTAGGAHITGGDLRGLMYALIEAADQIRTTGRLKREHAVPTSPIRGLRIHAEPQSSWFASPDFWRVYFAQLARERFNRVQIVFDTVPDKSGLATLRMIAQTASQYAVDAGAGIGAATPADLERLLVECTAIRFVAIHSTQAASDVPALLRVFREIGRRVVLELPADTAGTPEFVLGAGQSGTPVRLFSAYGAAPSVRPSDFYLTLDAGQLGSDADSVGALVASLGSGFEIASPGDSTGRPDAQIIGAWGLSGYGQIK